MDPLVRVSLRVQRALARVTGVGLGIGFGAYLVFSVAGAPGLGWDLCVGVLLLGAIVLAVTRRLRRLAEDRSTLSRADEGRLAIVPVPVDLAVVASAAASRLAPQAADAGIVLDVHPGAGPLWVRADPDRVAQIVTNLVGNAIHATPSGGTITVSAGSDGPRAVVTIHDSGVGLTAADLARVFERFYRAPGTVREHGSGVGLTIARMLARGHGGDVYAASPGPGLGATFTLVLPARAASA